MAAVYNGVLGSVGAGNVQAWEAGDVSADCRRGTDSLCMQAYQLLFLGLSFPLHSLGIILYHRQEGRESGK